MTREIEVEYSGSTSNYKVERFSDRLKMVMTGQKSRPFAQKVGVSEGTVRNLLGGGNPSLENLVKISRATNTLIEWLATGEGPMRASEADQFASDDHEYAHIPLYDVRAAAGHGAIVDSEQVVDSLCFKKEWIHNELHANPNDLYLIYVSGESIEPTLRPGDVILVDRRDTTVRRDGIYVLTMDNTLLVKRLQSLPGGKVRVMSDNPAYAPFDMDKGLLDAEFQDDAEGAGVIGRVVWTGRRM